jgi:hypothetical protein
MREGFEHCSADVSGVCFFLIVGVAARQLLLLSACLWFSRAYHQEGFLRRLPLSLAESLVHVVASVRASAVGVKVFLFLLFLLFFIFFLCLHFDFAFYPSLPCLPLRLPQRWSTIHETAWEWLWATISRNLTEATMKAMALT